MTYTIESCWVCIVQIENEEKHIENDTIKKNFFLIMQYLGLSKDTLLSPDDWCVLHANSGTY